jgi:probable O-glycosylation ligase (exosortase A-associated)
MAKLLFIFIPIYLAGLAAALLVDVSWGIFLYQLQYFFSPGTSWWYSQLPNIRYSHTIAVVILIGFVLRYKKYKENNLFEVPQTKWILILFGMMCIISLWAQWPEMHNNYLTSQLKLLIFLAIAYKVIDSPKKFEFTIWSFLIGQFYVAWAAWSLGRNYYGRLEGFGPPDSQEANDLGCTFITAIPLLIFYILRGKNWQKFAAIVLMAFILNGIILVNSRGAFLAAFGSCIYYCTFIILNKTNESKNRSRAIAAALCGIVLFVYLADETFFKRISTIADAAPESRDTGRIYFWEKAIDLAIEHPFGVGVYGYQKLSPNFLEQEFLTGGMRAVHSIHFQVLSEYGFPGFVAFVALIASNFKLLWKIKKKLLYLKKSNEYFMAVSLETSLVGFLIAATFLDRFYAEIFYWIMMYIACMYNIFFKKTEIQRNI